jgi:cyclopropane fatty-acyl-phospholipid synthase-like methyltransferase
MVTGTTNSENTGEGAKVRRYFDGVAERFDAIYHNEKSLSSKVVDRLFRGVIHRRFDLTFELCGEAAGRTVLEVGCGSGRYCLEFARRGAQVHGLDFAPAMIKMSADAAEADGLAERCRFEAVDFLTWDSEGGFDIALGIGFFDYIADPLSFLRKIRSLVGADGAVGQAVFSFPKRWNLRTPTRWLRLNLNRCPVHFYDRKQVLQLMDEAGWEHTDIRTLSRDYVVHGRTG